MFNTAFFKYDDWIKFIKISKPLTCNHNLEQQSANKHKSELSKEIQNFVLAIEAQNLIDIKVESTNEKSVL